MDFALQVGGDFDTVRSAAHYAEDRGLAAVALFDHYLLSEDVARASALPAFDPWVQLGALARETSSIELVVLVTPVTFRAPAVLAKMAVTLDHLSGGRFKMGLGSGWFEREHQIFGIPFPPTSTRAAQLEDTLGYLRAVFDPAHPGFVGEHAQLEPTPLAPLPIRGTLPLLVGGSGAQRTPRLAGTFADEYDLIELTIDEIPPRIAAMRAAARRAERDPDAVMVSYNNPVLGFDTTDERTAFVAEYCESTGRDRAAVEDRLSRTAALIGTWGEICSKVARLESLGVERYYLGHWDETWDPAAVDRFLGEVR